MALTNEQYQQRIREAISILTVPTEEDAKIRMQLAACNKWLETPDGREMMFKILPYFGSIMKFIQETAPAAAIGISPPAVPAPAPEPEPVVAEPEVIHEVVTEEPSPQEEPTE